MQKRKNLRKHSRRPSRNGKGSKVRKLILLARRNARGKKRVVSKKSASRVKKSVRKSAGKKRR